MTAPVASAASPSAARRPDTSGRALRVTSRSGRGSIPRGPGLRWASGCQRGKNPLLDLRPSSRARLDSAVRNQVLPEWHDVALSGIRNADVRAWIVRLHDQGYSASTVRKAAFALRRILSAAVADQRLTTNPAHDVPLPTSQPKEQRYLTADEVAVLADEIEPRYRAMVLLATYGGLRFGELPQFAEAAWTSFAAGCPLPRH